MGKNMANDLSKCDLLCITNKQNPQHCYYMNEEDMKSVSSVKCLGVTLDEHLTFNERIKKIVNKANQK